MKKHVNIDGMLLATFLTTIFYSATYPYINKQIMTVASDTLVAFNQMINCISIIVFSKIWNAKSERLFYYYPIFCMLEIVFTVTTTIFTILTHNIIAYYLLDTFTFAIITRNIICGGIKLRAIRYRTEKKRECFDNNNNSVASFATIFGSVIAMFLSLDFTTMLCLATLGNMIDNIIYIFVFIKTKKSELDITITCKKEVI